MISSAIILAFSTSQIDPFIANNFANSQPPDHLAQVYSTKDDSQSVPTCSLSRSSPNISQESGLVNGTWLQTANPSAPRTLRFLPANSGLILTYIYPGRREIRYYGDYEVEDFIFNSPEGVEYGVLDLSIQTSRNPYSLRALFRVVSEHEGRDQLEITFSRADTISGDCSFLETDFAVFTLIPEASEETLPEASEETLPEASEETLPEASEETLPEASEETLPEASEETLPEASEETLPEASEETLPEASEETLPEASEETLPEASEETLPE
jgi:hypothetical protein